MLPFLLLLSAQSTPDVDLPTPPPDLGGTGIATFVGDSVVAGSAASDAAHFWTAIVAAGLNGIEDNEGQGGRGVFNYVLSGVENKLPNDRIMFINLVINEVYSDPANAFTTGTPGSMWWLYGPQLQVVLDDFFAKGWLPSEIVVSTCYFIHFLSTNAAPWRQKYYSRIIERVCKENGCIYADLLTYMEAFPDRDDMLADTVHQNDAGMQRVADYFLNELDYTPAINDIDPLVRYEPYYTTAASTFDFEDVGVDDTNIEIIFEADDPLQCYVPGKTGNTITGMVNGTSYFVVPKLHEFVDLNTVGLPHPIASPTSGADEAAAFVFATGRASQYTAIQDFIEALKANDLWWRMYGFWILDTSFNVSKYNLRDATATVAEGGAGGAGTYASDGWTGAATKALLMGISPDDYDKTCTMAVSIVSDVHEKRNDFGMSGGTSATQLATRTDWSEPVSASFAYPGWNSGGAFTKPTTSAIGRWMLTGGKDYMQCTYNGVPTENYFAGPHVDTATIGEFTIGNSGLLTSGSTKKFRLAGIFHCLNEHDQYVLDGLVADFEAAL